MASKAQKRTKETGASTSAQAAAAATAALEQQNDEEEGGQVQNMSVKRLKVCMAKYFTIVQHFMN